MENAILPQMSSQLYYTFGCTEAFSDIPLQIESEIFCMDSNLYTNQANFGGVFCSESEFYCTSDAPSLLTVKSLGYPSLGWDHSFQVPTYNGKRLLVQQSENELRVTKTRKCSIEDTEMASTAKMAECFQDQVYQKHVKEPVKNIRGGRVAVRRNQKLSDKITALQKLVSPYGKTDTASVLLEASISIKALQDQIQKLSNTVRSSESNRECSSQVGLYGKGLCLVPVSLSQKVAEHNFFNQRLASLSCFTP